MLYRVLKCDSYKDLFEPLKRHDTFDNHGAALVEAEKYVFGASGRIAIVVADRDTFFSSVVIKRIPGSAPDVTT